MTLLVDAFMTTTVRSITPEAPLSQAYQLLREYAFSSLPVMEDGHLVGILSRSDLLRIGKVLPRTSPHQPLLELPSKSVRDFMKPDPVCVTPQTPVSAAAALMVSRHFHRVFVTENGKLLGVFSTRDVMDALQSHKLRTPISDYMSTPVLGIETTASVKHATDRLTQAGVSGLVVQEDDFPVGYFTQVEALQIASEPAATLVEDVMNYALLCLDIKTPIHRAAAQARATRVRRVLAVENRRVWGILTGLDFARAATTLP